ncbi:hypothetical protein BZG36_02663 [Bifiguratus adelaidae]|uniref:NmrA-like domain-containing protein n=1 Tax=Bifiguratus adelaidae TaxID=1938954 RepID=A0A261Y1V6_9FUNG|nr:hypothetical protein BZG36_02663 [Bifiguratus adelaidae]
MAVLLTGGTGKTSVRIARFLQDAKIPFLLASRRGEAAAPSGMPATKFDWLDDSTFEKPLQHKFPGGEGIYAVYLVAPEVADPAAPMNAFVDYAIKEHGVNRFVLIGVWQHFVDIGVEYCVLRPTWFMENFLEEAHRFTIKGEGKIYTACGDGKIPFVSATDIAAVAFRALTDEKPYNTDYRVLGPELLTYDEIAAKLSSCLGREVVHVKLTDEQRTQRFMSYGLPEHYANFLTSLEVSAASGVEDRMNDAVERVTGRPSQKFDVFAQQHKTAWQ